MPMTQPYHGGSQQGKDVYMYEGQRYTEKRPHNWVCAQKRRTKYPAILHIVNGELIKRPEPHMKKCLLPSGVLLAFGRSSSWSEFVSMLTETFLPAAPVFAEAPWAAGLFFLYFGSEAMACRQSMNFFSLILFPFQIC